MIKQGNSYLNFFQVSDFLSRLVRSRNPTIYNRDGNSSEIFIPRGIEESRNDKFTFLGDQGICYLFLGVLGKFRGMSYPKNQKIPLKI